MKLFLLMTVCTFVGGSMVDDPLYALAWGVLMGAIFIPLLARD